MVDLAEHVGLGDPQVVEEHLVEVVRAHHAADGSDLDRRIIHRHKEDRQALLLLLPLVGAREQKAPLRHGRVGRPDLLAADQPAVAVRSRGRPQGREVGARLRLGEALAPDHFATRDGRQVLALLLLGAVSHDDGPDPVDPHVLGAARLVVGPHLLANHGLLPDRGPAATEFLRPRQAQQTAVGQCPAELLGRLEVGGIVGESAQKIFRHMGVHQLTQLAAQVRGFWPHLEVHRRPYPEPTAGSMSAEPSPSSSSTSAVSAPSSRVGPAIPPGVRENQVGTPGIAHRPVRGVHRLEQPDRVQVRMVEQRVGCVQRRGGDFELAEQRQPLLRSCAPASFRPPARKRCRSGARAVRAWRTTPSPTPAARRSTKAFQCLSL